MVILSAWSSQGLIAHYNSAKNPTFITLIDQTVSIGDPFYRQFLGLKESKEDLASLHWNSTGSHLLAITKTGAIEIFRQTAGLINKFESTFLLKREEEKSPISLIWLENRRTFSFNSSNSNSNGNGANANVSLNNTSNNTSNNTPNHATNIVNTVNSSNNTINTYPFITKAFHLNLIPFGRLSFLLISSDGSIEIFIENSTKFDITKLNTFDPVLMGSFAFQRPNGTILIFLRTRTYWTISQISDNFEIEIKQKHPSENEHFLNSKFIWSELKESLIQLEGHGNQLKMMIFNCFSSSIPVCKAIDLPYEIGNEEILHSSRASNYLFLQSNTRILILNLNGEIVKQLSLSLDPENYYFDIGSKSDEVNVCDDSNGHFSTCISTKTFIDGPLLISPNGLVVAKISEDFDDFPIIIYSPIGEITLKNVIMLRDFLGKLISSTLNGSNSWDIFQLIRRSLQKSEEESHYFTFISTILSEWISLLEVANIPARDFYSKLMDLLRLLPMEFIDAYNLLDLNLRFLSIEKILLNSVIISNNQFEEYFESIKWPELDQISIESETNLISILPVLEEGLLLISELSKAYHDDQLNVFTLLPLENEIFRAIGLIFITSKFVQNQFKILKQKELNPKISDFFEQASLTLSSKLCGLETFSTFLFSLRSDPQIQSKCIRNCFLFLIEFYFDSANMKKVQGNVLRIFSRFSSDRGVNSGSNINNNNNNNNSNSNRSSGLNTTTTTSKHEFFDSIKCLNLPINQNSTILICRKCHRSSSTSTSRTFKSRREMIFIANWQQSLWKSRCQCGGIRRIVQL